MLDSSKPQHQTAELRNNPTLKSFQTHSMFYYYYYKAISLSMISHYKYINEVLASTHKSPADVTPAPIEAAEPREELTRNKENKPHT